MKKLKFSRKRNQRKALLKSLAANFILKEKIITTRSKAKELVSLAERLITAAKKGGLPNRRRLIKFLPEEAVKKLMKESGSKFGARQGGHIRVLGLGPRSSDAAKMVVVELVK